MASWKAKKQTAILRSSVEAEYRALAATTSELLWLSQLFEDFCINVIVPILLFYDNQAAIHIASNPTFHERTQHIKSDCHFVREKVSSRLIKLMPIRSQHQLVDIYTKALRSKLLIPLLSKMAVKNIYRPS